MLKSFSLQSNAQFEVIDINDRIKDIVEHSGIKEGICTIYVPHATAAIIINENYDPNIGTDLINALDRAFPLHNNYLHDKVDDNAAAHIKAAIIGPSKQAIIHHGKLMLGTWQDIMLIDFDGPKERKIYVKLVASAQ